MEALKFLQFIILSVLVGLPILMMTVTGQISTACANSMISSFTPCLNFITGSSGNGSSPSRDCCSALGSIIQSSTDCACLVLTGNVPFQLPINRTLAISLPRACNIASVPLQCRASATPLPAPAPLVPEQDPPAPAPLPDTFMPPTASPPATATAVPGLRPVLTPSPASKLSNMYSPSLVLGVLGIMSLMHF
ncbi:hypothetical protein MRB53_024048 [Persea americana]|uniref:Uncharacterized protein n=1 Tax=Persea americana TaxID=3435 RepID=A0ACC2LBT6_PERAE|nr:hypothetical protein MRB53_024048 [Persea americana]